MRGFKSHDAAARFCREHGELRNLLRPRRRHNQIVPPLSVAPVSPRRHGLHSPSCRPHESPLVRTLTTRRLAPALTEPSSENDVVFSTMFLRFPSLCLSQALKKRSHSLRKLATPFRR